MIRLRQIALVAADLASAVEEITRALDLDVVYRDPGVEFFGLHNALFCVGDQFIEIVSPLREGTTAGRLLEKMGDDGGYMALFEVDDLDARMALLDDLGVRRVWEGATPQIRGRHLHPRDTGGTLVSLDEPTVAGDWAWGGPTWRDHRPSHVVSSIESFTVNVPDANATQQRWRELGIDTAVHYKQDADRTEGLSEVHLRCVDPARDGETMTLVGTTFVLHGRERLTP